MSDHGHSHGASGQCATEEHHGHGHGHAHGDEQQCSHEDADADVAHSHGHGHGHGHGDDDGHHKQHTPEALVRALVAAVDDGEGTCCGPLHGNCCDCEGVCCCAIAEAEDGSHAEEDHGHSHGHGHGLGEHHASQHADDHGDHGHAHGEHGHDAHGDHGHAHGGEHGHDDHGADHGDHGHAHGGHDDHDDHDEGPSGNETKLKVMLVMTLGFFIAEITVGYMTHSLALVADSFHMLSDAFALVIGLVSVRLSKKDASNQFTFGWVRAEVVGALINGVFLLAVCFSITMESIERFVETEEIEKPNLLLGVGLGGLAINLFGMCLFSGHAHAHGGGGGGHGHSHGGGGGGKKKDAALTSAGEDVHVQIDDHDDHNGDHGHGHGHGLDASNGSTTSELDAALRIQAMNPIPAALKVKEAGDMNMHGVFLHLLGDFLGSIAVVIVALVIIYQTPGDDCLDPLTTNTTVGEAVGEAVGVDCETWAGVKYLDPFLSLVIVAIILSATIPLVKEAALVLMQTTPTNVDLAVLRSGVNKVGGVLGTHELHVWSLTGATLIASVHVTFKDAKTYVKAAPKIKDFFHVNGIHSLTLQPEFIGKNKQSFNTSDCLLPCADDSCETDSCCPTSDDQLGSLNARRSFTMPAVVRHSRASRSPSPATSRTRSPSKAAGAGAGAGAGQHTVLVPSGLNPTVTSVTSRGSSKTSSGSKTSSV